MRKDIDIPASLNTSPIQLTLEDDVLQSIGRAAAEFSYLELVLEIAIWGLAGLESDTGRNITAGLGIRPKVEMLRSLAHQRLSGSELDRLLKLVDCVVQVETDRNRVVHGLWAFTGKLGEVTLLRRKHKSRKKAGGVETMQFTMTNTEVQKIADDIWSVSDQLNSFLVDHEIWQFP